ncbi:MAG: hypothetical protein VB086_03410 [Clostridiaceae bacterium]|nr:hypothetical protein [Clostridiaceae bacterium]
MSKTFRGTLLGGFRRKDVIAYLEKMDTRQKEDLRHRERETEEARKQADQTYAELSAAREAAANLRAALAAQRTENTRLSQHAGQLEARQAAMQETMKEPEEKMTAAPQETAGLSQLSQLCDRLDEALLRLEDLMRDDRDTAAAGTGEPEKQQAGQDAAPAGQARHTPLSELLDRVRPH